MTIALSGRRARGLGWDRVPASFCYDPVGWCILLDDGSISPCFVDGVIVTAPSVILVIFGLLELRSLLSRKARPHSLTLTDNLKMVCSFCWDCMAAPCLALSFC
jgi:hypothetical protein